MVARFKAKQQQAQDNKGKDSSKNTDESPPFGLFLKAEIEKHYRAKGKEATVKYIDPSYCVRAVAANAFDQVCVNNLLSASTPF